MPETTSGSLNLEAVKKMKKQLDVVQAAIVGTVGLDRSRNSRCSLPIAL